MNKAVRYIIGFSGFFLLASIVGIAIVGMTGHSSAASSTAPAPSQPPRPTNIPQPSFRGPFQTPTASPLGPQNGSAAIKPSIATTNAQTPAFTQADVTSYLAGKTWGGSSLTVKKVTFMTIHDMNASGSMNLRYADNQLICLVQLTGVFNDVGTQRTTMYQVFDAHTGNLLGWSYR